MLFRTFLFFVASVFSSLSLADNGPAVPDYPADKLADNLYVIHGPVTTPNVENQGFMNNPGIVLTSKGVVIVDPGGTLQSGEMVLRVLSTITKDPVVAVFNTHVHGDHWLGNQAIKQAYPKAVIYAHKNTIQEAKASEGQAWKELMLNSTHGQSAGTEPVVADTAVADGDVIKIGGDRFEIVHFPVSHTDTDIMIALNQDEALFMGDNLFNGRLIRTAHGNIKTAIEAAEKTVDKFKPKIIVPGHGKSGDLAMANFSLDILRILYRSVQQLYEEDLSDYEMKPIIEKQLKAYKAWVDFDGLLGKTISQAYLEIEAADF